KSLHSDCYESRSASLLKAGLKCGGHADGRQDTRNRFCDGKTTRLRKRAGQQSAWFHRNRLPPGDDKAAMRAAALRGATGTEHHACSQESLRQWREAAAEIGDRRINRNCAGHPFRRGGIDVGVGRDQKQTGGNTNVAAISAKGIGENLAAALEDDKLRINRDIPAVSQTLSDGGGNAAGDLLDRLAGTT